MSILPLHLRLRASVTLAAIILAGFFAAPHALAQANASPPERMTYQGFLADGNGNPLGNTNTGPKNYDVIFRIWAEQSGGAAALWAEQQTVTVDKGYFSVLLGEGTVVTPGPEHLSSLFTNATASDRFVEMTVKGIGAGGGNVTILPRLRLLSSPYSFLSQSALRLVSSSGGDLVTSVFGGVNVNGSISANGTISASSFVGNGGGLTGFTAGQIPNFDASKITSGTIDELRLSANIARLDTANAFASSMTVGGQIINSMANGSFATSFSAPFGGTSLGAQLIAAGANGPQFRFMRGSDGKFFDIGQNGSGGFTIEDTDVPRLTIDSLGKVGIGINPSSTLSVAGNADFLNRTTVSGNSNPSLAVSGNNGAGVVELGIASNPGGYSASASLNDAVLRSIGGKLHLQTGAAAAALTIDTANRVGIGTATPNKAALHVETSLNTGVPAHNFININAIGVQNNGGSSQLVSIYGAEAIWSGTRLMVSSDQRMKAILGTSDHAADLQTLLGIEITDYRYKDVIGKGAAPQKKVIAQQVEKIFPQAVSKHTDVVPDIYQKAPIKNGWTSLATDLKKGDRVKLITEKAQGLHEVLEVTKDGFRTDFKPEGDVVFVFGREVNDFRTVDYEAIAMLNVSATQELARRVERLEKRESHLAALEQKAAQLVALEQELADLKKLVAELAQAHKGPSPTAAAVSSPVRSAMAQLNP